MGSEMCIRDRGRIHEQPFHRLPMHRLDLIFGHDGYTLAQLQEKRGRNRELLLRVLADKPDDAYTLYQLGKDDDAYNNPAAANEHFRRARALTPPDAAWRHDLVMRSLVNLQSAGALEEAMQLAADEMPHWQHSPDYHFLLAELLFARFKGRPDQGRDLLPMIEQSLLKALELGDNDALSGTMKGRGSFLAADRLWALHQAQGHVDQARHYDALRHSLREPQQAEPLSH